MLWSQRTFCWFWQLFSSNLWVWAACMVLRQTRSRARQSPCSPGHLLLDQSSLSSLVKDTSIPQSVTASLLYGHIFPVVPIIFQCFRWDFKTSLVNFSPLIFHSFWIQLTDSLVAQRKRIHLQCRRLAGDTGSIPGSERSPREGNSNPLKHSCLGNLMDREALWATVHGFSGSDTTDQPNSNNKRATHVSWCSLSFEWRRQGRWSCKQLAAWCHISCSAAHRWLWLQRTLALRAICKVSTVFWNKNKLRNRFSRMQQGTAKICLENTALKMFAESCAWATQGPVGN